jgi:CRISPR-associated endonuclease/helicase Cas3
MERVWRMPSDQVNLFEAQRDGDACEPTPDRVFKALTGFEPLPWQRRTLAAWIAQGPHEWGGVVSVPTGLGKSMLPVLALVASAYVEHPPRRYVYVVNRRIVVDQTYRIAMRVAEHVRAPESLDAEDRAVVIRFREMLYARMGLNAPEVAGEVAEAPIVHLLRGGTDDRLLKIGSPVVPTIIVSTIDQAGSRLLMRGYGLSRKAWPIQGGILAYDTLWIVDEAHTAKPFLSTLKRVRRAIHESKNGARCGQPFTVIEASATHPDGRPFSPGNERERTIANARKNLSIEILEEAPKRGEFGKRAASFVLEGLQAPDVRRINVVANTIGSAREAFAAVKKALDKHGRDPKYALLIGAIREKEREALLQCVGDDLDPDREPERPVVIVSTQTIETGPDFSFDWTLSELASLDAIAQRLGRTNRRGTSANPRSLVWGFPERSPIYADAPEATAKILASWGETPIVASPLDLQQRIANSDPALVSQAWSPSSLAEALFGARLRDLGRTYPPNRQETDVAWYLHGERGGEVEIVWRPNLEAILREADREKRDDTIKDYVEALPVERGEALTLSTRGARALLRNNAKSDVSDGGDNDPQESVSKNERHAIVLRGDDTFVCGSREIRAGDIIFVPITYGWYDRYGFAPGLRFNLKSEDTIAFSEDGPSRRVLETKNLPCIEDEELIEDWTDRVVAHLLENPEIDAEFKATMQDAARIEVLPHPLDDAKKVVRATKRFGCSQDDDSGANVEICLEPHNLSVGRKARVYGRVLGLSDDLVDTLGLGGDYHDLGKADLSYQRIRLGNHRASTGIFLAKSKRGRNGKDTLRYRHEVGSVKMLDDVSPLTKHLVGTHHGYGRPGFPFCDKGRPTIAFSQQGATRTADGSQDLDKIGGEWREQFANLERDYSPWGLAYLEAILRLADHRVSEAERKSSQEASTNAA